MIEGNTYKLHEIPRHSWIKFDSELMLFNKIDGMYSLCMSKGKVVHLFASTEVEYVGEFEGFEYIEHKDHK